MTIYSGSISEVVSTMYEQLCNDWFSQPEDINSKDDIFQSLDIIIQIICVVLDNLKPYCDKQLTPSTLATEPDIIYIYLKLKFLCFSCLKKKQLLMT